MVGNKQLLHIENITVGYSRKALGEELDFGLLALGNDGDMHRMGIQGLTVVLLSPTKVIIKESVNDVSPELDRNQKKGKYVVSSRKKLVYSQSIVPYGTFSGPSQVIQGNEPLMDDEPVMNDEQIIDNELVIDDEYDCEDSEDEIRMMQKTVLDEETLNNDIYPVAYAIVETENINSWTWFLEHLDDDLDLNSSSNFTFISYWKKGDELREAVWCCGKVYSILKFNRAIEKLKKLNPEAHEWLSKIHAKHWAKSHFSRREMTDSLTNNLCEVFNSKLDEARYKPIIICLEFIREYLTKRIKNNKIEANKMNVLFSEVDKYQVTVCCELEREELHLQEIGNYMYSMPACYCCNNGSEYGDPEAWVNKCYWLNWQVGEKKKKRAADETNQSTSLRMKYLTVTCSNIHNKGHNARTCKGQGGPMERGVDRSRGKMLLFSFKVRTRLQCLVMVCCRNRYF
uniref:MULE transposase domain-containing protein n=1 Tax=Lactuca sativa TaxID=4236 RepID=A0A9R1X1F5_LACSA|nr:hypothetical protein LSAT_V11C700381600 [Lactuca sativa]